MPVEAGPRQLEGPRLAEALEQDVPCVLSLSNRDSNITILETRHGPDDARRSLQVLRCKLVDWLIVFFFANRIVGEPSAAGKLDTWPNRPGPMVS